MWPEILPAVGGAVAPGWNPTRGCIGQDHGILPAAGGDVVAGWKSTRHSTGQAPENKFNIKEPVPRDF